MSHVTLRLLKPECVLDKSWCQEELSLAVKRAVILLHSHTITSRVGKGEPGKVICATVSLGFLRLWPWADLFPLWPCFFDSEKWGVVLDGGFLSPVLVSCESLQPPFEGLLLVSGICLSV